MAGLRKKAVTGVLWTSAETVGVRLVNLASFLVLARILAKEDLGLVALASVYIAFVELVVRVGVTEVIVQRDKLSDLHKDTAYWATAILGIIAIVASILIAPIAASWSDEYELEAIIYWLAIGIVPVSLSRVQQGLLMRNMDFRTLAIRRMLSITTGSVVGIAMALNGYGVWSLVAQQLVQRFVELVTLYWVTRWFPRLRFSWSALSELWEYSSRVLAINILHFASSNVDQLLIGHFFGTAALGTYVVGKRIVEVVFATLKNVVGRVALSTFSRLQSDLERLFEASLAVARIIALIGFPVMGLFIFFGNDITTAFFGEKWREAGMVCQIVAVGMAARISTMFAPPLLKAKGHPGAALRANIAMVVTSIVISTALQSFGFYAFIAGWVSGALIFGGVILYLAIKMLHYPVQRVLKQYIGPFTAVILSGLFTSYVEPLTHSYLSGAVELTLFRVLCFSLSYAILLPLVSFGTIRRAYQDVSVMFPSRKKRGAP
jgi:polysaccharide transporter, PST family